MGQFLQLHETPDAFREALSFSEAQTGFAQRLIEKDYYCSLILADFEPLFLGSLAFKGGTCLSKVHAAFYRLSEDLDFAISIPASARRSSRRKAVVPIKDHLENITERLPALEMNSAIVGHNESRQYEALLHYTSAISGEQETVKVEVAVREPIIEPMITCDGKTLLRFPLSTEMPDTNITLSVLSLRETYAEKVRAALTRDPPAIRDVFDIDDAVRAQRLDLTEPAFLSLVRQKLAVPGYGAIDTSRNRREIIKGQLETHLKPVLRSSDFRAFDIERAFAEVDRLAAMIGDH